MRIQPIGVPYDLNRPNFRTGRTPALLLPRLAGLHSPAIGEPAMIQVPSLSGDEQRDLAVILAALAGAVRAAHEQGALPLIIGGDCMASLGVMAGLGDAAAGIVWLDAHGDFNTPETTPSGYLGGMTLATIAGRGLAELRVAVGLATPLPEDRIVLLGPRDLDPPEQTALEASPVALFSTQQVRDNSLAIEAALARLGHHGPVFLHLDVDILDPADMPGVVYPAADGLRTAELLTLLRHIRSHCTLAALALTALNPAETHREQVLGTATALLQAALLPEVEIGQRVP